MHFNANGVAGFQKWLSRCTIEKSFHDALLRQARVAGAALSDWFPRPIICATVRNRAGAYDRASGKRAGAGRVSDLQWKRFLAREVTPRFPNGLTVLEGYGQWMAPHGTLAKERSRVLLIWHDQGDSADRKLDTIRAIYKHQFRQTSVMRVDGMDCVSF